MTMPDKDDYSDAWNASNGEAVSAEAKRLKALQDQSDASASQLAEEFSTAYLAATEEPKA